MAKEDPNFVGANFAFYDGSTRDAPRCSSLSVLPDTPPGEPECRCVPNDGDHSGSPNEDKHSGSPCGKLKYFCYLEGVLDPKDPTRNCFKDVKWSVSKGRFWSYDACNTKRLNN